MNPIGEKPRADQDVPDEGATSGRNRLEDGQGCSANRQPLEVRRAAIDQFCERLTRDFDETVIAIESVLGVRSKSPEQG